MFTRLLIVICINLAFICSCLSAEESWYPTATSSAPKILTLNCILNAINSGSFTIPETQVALTIDYTNSTVNGYKAQIYENEIRWDSKATDGSTFHVTLNRLSGFIGYGDEEFATIRSGHCTPATRQF